MENIVCKVCIVVGISATHIIALIATLFNKFLELRYDNIVAALAAYGFSKVVMYFFSAVKAKYKIRTRIMAVLPGHMIKSITFC